MSMSFPSALILRSLAGFAAASCVATSAANAAFITEYFDYGATAGNMPGKGATGGGWAAAWGGSTDSKYSTDNLTYTATGYSNAGNTSGTGSAAGVNRGVGNGGTRSFSSAMSGTIWISMLARHNSASNPGALLWLGTSGQNDFIGLLGNLPQIRVNGTSTNLSAAVAGGTTHLFLAKLEIDYSGSLDRLTGWINPDLTNLGTGTSVSGVDIVGSSLTGITVSLNDNDTTPSNLDAIRISNDSDGFDKVTAVPEPASLSLLALAGGAMLRRRRGS